MKNFMQLHNIGVSFTELQSCYFFLSIGFHPAKQKQLASTYTPLHQVFMSRWSQPEFCVYLLCIWNVTVEVSQRGFWQQWVLQPTRTSNALSLRQRLFLSQKRANHMKKWMPYFPDILVIRIHNHGGNNVFPKQWAGSQSYRQIAKSFQEKKKNLESITIRHGNSCWASLTATATENVLAVTSKACHTDLCLKWITLLANIY